MNTLFKMIFSTLIVFAGSQAFAIQDPDAKLSKYLKMRQTMRNTVQITPYAGPNSIGFQDNTVTLPGDEDVYKADPQTGSSVGFLVDYNTSFYSLGVQTGLVYHQFASQFNQIDQGNETSIRYQDSYVSLPLSLKIYPFSRAGQLIFFKAGLAINALTDSKEILTSTKANEVQESVVSTKMKDERNDFDVQAIVGLGIVVNLTDRLGFLVEGNYHSGLVDNNRTPEEGDPEYRTQGFTGIFGLTFTL